MILKNKNFWLILCIGICLIFLCASVHGLELYEKGDTWIVWNISSSHTIKGIYINGIAQKSFDANGLMFGIQGLEPNAPYTIKLTFNGSPSQINTQTTNEKAKTDFDKFFEFLDYYFVLILFCCILVIAVLTMRFLAFIVSVLSIGMFTISLAVKNDFYLSFAFIILFIVSLMIGYEGVTND